jgi:LEA14-like dessication related protein
MKRSSFFTLPLLLFLVCTACRSFTPAMKEPVLSLNALDLSGVNFTGVDLIARVTVENPNAFGIPFPQLDWEFFINAGSFIKGTVKNDNTIKARTAAVVDIPFSLSYQGIYHTFQSLRGSQEADYTLVLNAAFPTAVQGKTYTFKTGGVLPLPRMPLISAPAFSIARLDFNGLGIVCTFNVENPNEFPVPSPRIAWDYLVEGNSLVKSSLEDPRLIPAKAVSPVDIRVDIAYSDLYQAIRSLPGGREAPFVVAVKADFPIPALEGLSEALDISGTIPLIRQPELRFRGVGARNISLERAEFLLTWEVENPNSFELTIEAFDYDFAVNNTPWAQGRVADVPKLGPNKTTAIPLIITINSLAMIRDVTGIMSRRADVTYACGGTMRLSGGPPGLAPLDMSFNFTGSTKLRN